MKPTLDDLKSMEWANGDGAGVMWTDGKKAHYIKGTTAENVHETLMAVPSDWAVHFRINSIGGKLPVLTHPFVVTDDCPLELGGESEFLLMHNGHWAEFNVLALALAVRAGREIPDGPWSDSRAAAWLAAIGGHRLLEFIPGRFCLMGPGGYQIFPRLREGWISQDGMWFSNLAWKGRRPPVSTPPPSVKGTETATVSGVQNPALPLIGGNTDGGREIVSAIALRREAEGRARRFHEGGSFQDDDLASPIADALAGYPCNGAPRPPAIGGDGCELPLSSV